MQFLEKLEGELMLWEVFMFDCLFILSDQKSVDKTCPSFLVRTLTGAELRRQTQMVY